MNYYIIQNIKGTMKNYDTQVQLEIGTNIIIDGIEWKVIGKI